MPCATTIIEENIMFTHLKEYEKMLRVSSGKSSIDEERLYSFFFVFFQQKNEASFFCFSSIPQLVTKTFVLLWSCKIFKRYTSLCFVFTNFWNTPIRFTFDFEKVGLIPYASLCSSKILEQPSRFCFNLQKIRNKQFVLLSILLYFGLNSFLLRSWQVVGLYWSFRFDI